MAVAHPSDSFVYRRQSPIASGISRYSSDEVAMPPPVMTSPFSSVCSPRNVEAVTSVKATMM